MDRALGHDQVSEAQVIARLVHRAAVRQALQEIRREQREIMRLERARRKVLALLRRGWRDVKDGECVWCRHRVGMGDLDLYALRCRRGHVVHVRCVSGRRCPACA